MMGISTSMDHIKISFAPGTNLTDIFFSVKINGVGVDYALHDNELKLRSDQILFGINKLTISVLSDLDQRKLKIEKFTLNDALSRQTLFLAYSENQQEKFSNTWLSQQVNTITIPFGNPISWWITYANKKIGLGNFGENLYKNYNIYYPDSIVIADHFPRMMQDWFKYNFDFTVSPKSDLTDVDTTRSIPYFTLDFEYDEFALYNELQTNLPLVQDKKLSSEGRQDSYNTQEFANNYWAIYAAIHPKEMSGKDWRDSITLPKEHFPLFHALLDKINSMGIKISYGFISETTGKSFVAPHIHPLFNYSVYQISLPIGWSKESLFKIDGVGLLPTDRCTVFNDYDFYHGTINPTENTRYVIGINCDFSEYFAQGNL